MHEPTFRILLFRAEVEEAAQRGRSLGLARAPVHEKWWDNLLAVDALRGLEREPVVDLGCRTGIVLTWLHQQGFRTLAGCDLRRPVPPVIGSLRQGRVRDAFDMSAMYLRHRSRMYRAPVEATGFPDGAFAAATCMSVIEHGVDLPRFFAEAYRILRPGGRLVVSTDYWPEPIDMANSRLWNDSTDVIFDVAGLERMIDEAGHAGFLVPIVHRQIGEPVVFYRERRYTFVLMTFSKPNP